MTADTGENATGAAGGERPDGGTGLNCGGGRPDGGPGLDCGGKARGAGWFLLVTVFVTGMSVMAIEMSASRLVAPFFGTSLIVWTNIIGMIMASLSAGYYIGGRLADKRPEWPLLYRIITVSGGFVFAIPFIAGPVMSSAASGTVGTFLGSLLAVMVLFIVPFTLLGMVSPFVIRLAATGLDDVGNTAGSIYALSTVGSIIGTYLPALLFIPLLGTRRTILFFAASLLTIGVAGLLFAAARARRDGDGESSSRRLPAALVPLLAFTGALVGPPGPVKAVVARGRTKLLETESPYNYIQVHERDISLMDGRTRKRRFLVLNEGFAVHSVYDPDSAYFPFVGSVWDYFGLCALPLALPGGPAADGRMDVCIVGLAAGTISKELFGLYGDLGDLRVDGVEIDPEIIRIGREYFGMNEPGLNAVAEDGRTFIAHCGRMYDLLITDAYKQPYIPFHLATVEYYRSVASHLKDGGVMALNVGTLSDETELFKRIVATARQVFPHVCYVPVAFKGALFVNYVVLCSKRPLDPERALDPRKNPMLSHAVRGRAGRLARGILKKTLSGWTELAKAPDVPPLTDDKAPVEMLTDWLIIEYIMSGKAQEAMAGELGARSSGRRP